MTKLVVASIIIGIIAVGLLWPVLQPVRESECGPRNLRESDQARVDSSEGIPSTNASDNESTSWPNDVAGLVDHLNKWHPDELAIYNEPELFPNQVPSGETGGWISAHMDELKKQGAVVMWDKHKKRYVVAEQ